MPDPTSSADAGPMTLGARLVGAFRRWLQALRPAPMRVDAGERLRVVAGAIAGVLVTAVLMELLSRHAPGVPRLVAPLGASAGCVRSTWPTAITERPRPATILPDREAI